MWVLSAKVMVMAPPKLRLYQVLIISLASSGCVVEQDPDWVDPAAETTEGPTPGDLWCSKAVGALVSHNGQPVPGVSVTMTDGEWPVGCQCVDDPTHLALMLHDELDGNPNGSVILADNNPLAIVRDAVHIRTVINCQRRAYEIAEELFCINYCGEPFYYDWDDFSDFTSENCREVVLPETPLSHIGTVGDCDQDESDPLP